ncbi:hypothetical protein [Polyangium jinanense]|uniref:Uncharacterized protein n=1 Tax=Polyangium jinanense TaxID=2829994 RepID=A0A9X4APX4_9BACT|nr:hypothetical protein [Polyangium jinanense]MDC3952875.1 hypothetical protein [Polyangium jinanense]MDC3980494.1 hypothetical protein [Polyangium jinanense]
MLRARAPSLIVALLASLGLAADAHASSGVRLRWSAPEGCPTAEAISAEVDRLLGGRGAQTEPLDVTAEVKRDAGRYRVRLETRGEEGPRTREVEATTCAALGEAAALIIAMMIDPDVIAEPPPEVPPTTRTEAHITPSPPATTPTDTRIGPSPPATTPTDTRIGPSPPPHDPNRSAYRFQPSPPRPEPIRVSPSKVPLSVSPQPPPPPMALSVRALADVGAFPAPTVGFGAALSLFVGRYRLEAGISFLPTRTFPFPNLDTATGDIDLTLAHVGACAAFLRRPPFELGPCVSFEAGRIQSTSAGISSPGQGAAAWLAVSAGGRFTWTFARPVALVAGLGAGVPVVHPELAVSGLGAVHRASPVLGRAELGIEVRF